MTLCHTSRFGEIGKGSIPWGEKGKGKRIQKKCNSGHFARNWHPKKKKREKKENYCISNLLIYQSMVTDLKIY